jgi:hypothetical protein
MKQSNPRRCAIWVRALLIAPLALLAAVQLVPVERGNPPVRSEIPAPAAALAVLRDACYDCHSNETRWPWYGRVAPISWLVARDVSWGRDAVNYSEWDRYAPGEQQELIELTLAEIDSGRMPLAYYLPMHPEARVGRAERDVIASWIEALEREREAARADDPHR